MTNPTAPFVTGQIPRRRHSFPAQAAPPAADGGAVGLTASVVCGRKLQSAADRYGELQ